MWKADINEKKFVAAMCLHPEICPQSWALVKIQNQFFTMKQSYFCNFDIKNEFLDPQNPHVKFSGITLLQKWNYSTILKTREQNLPLVAENSNCENLKTT